MDRVNAPSSLWFICLDYVANLLNHLAVPKLNHRTPIEAAYGVTPDISAYLQFHFYQPVFYLDTNHPLYPRSRECYGYWIGVAPNVGDALTYKILTPEHQVIFRSTLRAASDPLNYNLRQGEEEPGETVLPSCQLPCVDPTNMNCTNPTLTPPENMAGYKFITNHQGFPHRATVVGPLEQDPTKYLVELGDGDRQEIMTYQQIMDLVEDQLDTDENTKLWTYESILDHRKNNKNKFEVLVKWTTGEETWEPLTWIAHQDPMTLATYAKEHGLLNQPGWK
jgi:hypothetical protein